MNIQNWTIPKKRQYILKNGSRKKRFRGRSFPIFFSPDLEQYFGTLSIESVSTETSDHFKVCAISTAQHQCSFFFVYLERLNKFLEQRN